MAAFQGHHNYLAARYAAQVGAMYQEVIGYFGPTFRDLRGAAARTNRPGRLYREIRSLLTKMPPGPRDFSFEPQLSPERVSAAAIRYADTTVGVLVEKAADKAGDLDDADLEFIHGVDFCLTGTRNGHDVEINQRMILNVSPLGKLFNQFPMRLTVNGQAVAAADYLEATDETSDGRI